MVFFILLRKGSFKVLGRQALSFVVVFTFPSPLCVWGFMVTLAYPAQLHAIPTVPFKTPPRL